MVSAGDEHFLVLTNDLQVHAFGNNKNGQCKIHNSVQGRAINVAASTQISFIITDDL